MIKAKQLFRHFLSSSLLLYNNHLDAFRNLSNNLSTIIDKQNVASVSRWSISILRDNAISSFLPFSPANLVYRRCDYINLSFAVITERKIDNSFREDRSASSSSS